MMGSLGLRKGEVVEVRGLDEIVSTLDGQGKMDGLAFMPEMGRLCGQRFRVHARADRTCVEHMGKRGLDDTVWLEDVRCDGSAHDGCQIACLIFWKEAWLKRVEATAAAAAPGPAEPVSPWPFPIKDEATGKYTCQSTSLEGATKQLGFWGNGLTHLRDLYYGNVSLARLAKVLFIYATLKLRGRYKNIRDIHGDVRKTPTESLELEPDEVVEVKAPDEIRSTLDVNGRNRGMLFTLDLLDFCGGRYEVEKRIDRCIDEGTSEMRSIKHSVILKGVTCPGTYRRGCMRCTKIIWREAWLKRVADANM
jgi:hypothetical protein